MPSHHGLEGTAEDDQPLGLKGISLEVPNSDAFKVVLDDIEAKIECVGGGQEGHQGTLLELVGQNGRVTTGQVFVFE